MKRTAIFSDVHSNLAALQKCIADAEEQGCEEFLCLGDLIGYGPNPRQVMEIAIDRFRFTLMGNHEEGILFAPVGFNWKAEASAWWTKDILRSKRYSPAENRLFWTFLESMPRFREEGDCLYVHASPLDPTKEYVMPEAGLNHDYMKTLFHRVKRVAFGGHTHLPGVFTPDKAFLMQSSIPPNFPVTNGKFFVNVGSVGQPRDGDRRSCYVIFDGQRITFRRVIYNFKQTALRIKRIRRLPNALGTRLALGL